MMGVWGSGKESEPRHLVCYPVMDVAADVQEAQIWCGRRIGRRLMGVWGFGKESEPRYLVCYPVVVR